MKKFLKEFKEFVMRGNVLDLAVGVIIGSAFQGLVTSLTKNILMPIITIFGAESFSDLKIPLNGNNAITYGEFINAVINFLIMAFVVFLIVKLMNKIMNLGATKEKEEANTKICKYCQSKISVKATRCPHCTSILEGDTIKAASAKKTKSKK